jgi:Ras-related GTP-binding protein A/B
MKPSTFTHFTSSNNPASLTSRLGVTIDVEQNHVRFLGDLILNLWDCGGQDSFMQSYLSTQQSTIFSNVGVLIYVFDLHSREVASDLEYFRRCLEALRKYSRNAAVFLLVHKMDLAGANREASFNKKNAELLKESESVAPGLAVTVFGTSIFDESLYKVS